ncbi:unnamed protein product [Symbiodinium microadriaticum]|nr:unnamed protein product [Symbiodinium microadriaticum]
MATGTDQRKASWASASPPSVASTSLPSTGLSATTTVSPSLPMPPPPPIPGLPGMAPSVVLTNPFIPTVPPKSPVPPVPLLPPPGPNLFHTDRAQDPDISKQAVNDSHVLAVLALCKWAADAQTSREVLLRTIGSQGGFPPPMFPTEAGHNRAGSSPGEMRAGPT